MSVTTIKQNILYGLGEGQNVANSTYLSYALRWANAAYREIFLKGGYKFKHINKRSVFRTTAGQATYDAPNDFIGFVNIKDETNDGIIDQVTPEEFNRSVSTVKITDEAFTSSHDVAVGLDYPAIYQYSETVTSTDGATTYTRDTDYTMSYASGEITVLSTGSMADATGYEIDYLYHSVGKPNQFCFEYNATNRKYVFRFDPVPEAAYLVSLIYPANPSQLSDSVSSIWDYMEFAVERGGIYYGALEIGEPGKVMEYKQVFKDAVIDLVRVDQDLVPKRNQIPVITRHYDYTNRRLDYITR